MMVMSKAGRNEKEKKIAKKKRALLKQRYQPKFTGQKENILVYYLLSLTI